VATGPTAGSESPNHCRPLVFRAPVSGRCSHAADERAPTRENELEFAGEALPVGEGLKSWAGTVAGLRLFAIGQHVVEQESMPVVYSFGRQHIVIDQPNDGPATHAQKLDASIRPPERPPAEPPTVSA